MGYGDCYRALYRDYYRDPFPHSLLSTRESFRQECVHASELRSVQDQGSVGHEGPNLRLEASIVSLGTILILGLL